MGKILIHPGYFGSIDQFCLYAKADGILWEVCDNYQKQTYRNRQYIYGANGKLGLNIPVRHLHSGEGRQPYAGVEIENKFAWQKDHWKSLESAYRSSPYFEYYEDEIRFLYQTRFESLMEFNFRCAEAITACLEIDLHYEKTTEYFRSYKNRDGITDCRNLILAKRKSTIALRPYSQVFDEKKGFIPNLSILDLLFNEGPQTALYLQNS